MRKKLFTLLLAVAASVGAMFAEKVQIGDLYYNLDATNKTAEVTYSTMSINNDNYSGLITANIPASVVYDEVEYSVTSIGESAFNSCERLTFVTIPNSVTSIGVLAFSFCSNLTFVTIPNSVINIENGPFTACINLKTIIVGADNPNYCSMDGVLFNKDKTQLIQYPGGKQGAYSIPSSVTSIGDEAFYLCLGLTSIDIPNSVTSIGIYAFTACMNLTSVVIGNGVKEIRRGTFVYCPLKSITIGTGIRKISLDAFFNIEMNGFGEYGEPMPKLDAAGNFIYTVEKVICYSKVPQTIEIPSDVVGGDFWGFLDNFTEADIYVPKESVARYQAYNDTWGKLGILPIEAATTDVTDLIVTPSSSSAEITWPQVSGAASYELVIKDKSDNVVCTLIFNAQGQLTSIAFNAPSRDGAPQRTQTAGFAFTVTGLDAGTSYDLTITSKDNNGSILDTQTVTFFTSNIATGIDNAQSDQVQSTKHLRDGQIYILRGDKTYTLTGQEVK